MISPKEENFGKQNSTLGPVVPLAMFFMFASLFLYLPPFFYICPFFYTCRFLYICLLLLYLPASKWRSGGGWMLPKPSRWRGNRRSPTLSEPGGTLAGIVSYIKFYSRSCWTFKRRENRGGHLHFKIYCNDVTQIIRRCTLTKQSDQTHDFCWYHPFTSIITDNISAFRVFSSRISKESGQRGPKRSTRGWWGETFISMPGERRTRIERTLPMRPSNVKIGIVTPWEHSFSMFSTRKEV